MSVRFEAESLVPTVHGEMRMRAYRDGDHEHLAVVSDPLGDTPTVRVHSECLTGEALGSLKCDCSAQLDGALATIGANGGVVIYLRGHEGRGIGLVNKIRAYRLQERGLDTVDANVALGLPVDARDYSAAGEILAELGIRRIRLLTNNPDKVRALEECGIAVSERVPLVLHQGAASDDYLTTKRDRMGHLIG